MRRICARARVAIAEIPGVGDEIVSPTCALYGPLGSAVGAWFGGGASVMVAVVIAVPVRAGLPSSVTVSVTVKVPAAP
jgi:hypothetical protein